MMPHACKVPLGREETEMKSRKTELKLFKSRARQNLSHCLPADWARELFKPSTEPASLLVSI